MEMDRYIGLAADDSEWARVAGGDSEGGSGRGGAGGDGEATRCLDASERQWLTVIRRGCGGDPGRGWAEGK